MEKKISFEFSKFSKKTNIFNNSAHTEKKDNIELIKCLEDQSIHLVEEKRKEARLVIPLKDNRKTSKALLSLKTREAVLNGRELPIQEVPKLNLESPSRENKTNDLDGLAIKELFAEINKDIKQSGLGLVLPAMNNDLSLEGAKESTIEDYDSIPIAEFGLALLRGMGWKNEPTKKDLLVKEKFMRPKGMGLGADKALKPKALLVHPEVNEVLEIKKGACVRVLGGKHKDLYGKVEGLDDHAGRVIIQMALGGRKESFNEFMVQPVSRKEFTQYSKCIKDQNQEKQVNQKDLNYFRPETSHYSKNKLNEEEGPSDKNIVVKKSLESDDYRRQMETNSRYQDKSNYKYSNSKSNNHMRHRSRNRYTSESSSSDSERKHRKKSKKSKRNKEKKSEIPYYSQPSKDERSYKKKSKKSKRSRSRSRSKGKRQ